MKNVALGCVGNHVFVCLLVERRRKEKIRSGIKQLSEILKPPCQCGKAVGPSFHLSVAKCVYTYTPYTHTHTHTNVRIEYLKHLK